MKRMAIALAVATAGVAVHVRPAAGALVAYEGFDYTPAAAGLAGQNGGSGFLAGWSAPAAGPNRVDVISGSLGYTDSLGNVLQTSGNSVSGSGATGNADISRSFAAGDTGTGTTWMSFVGVRNAPHATTDENVGRASSLQLRLTTTEQFAVGKASTGPGIAGAPPHTYNWQVFHSGQLANAQNSDNPLLTQSFLVARIDHTGDNTVADTVTLWVNPVLGADLSAVTPDAVLTGTGSKDMTFNAVRLFVGNAANGNPYASMAFDELRLGTTYADVSPIAIPEPTALAALGLGGASLLARRRRA